MSTRPVVFNLVNCIIGVSVLAMPFCFQECGIVLCAVAIAFSAWLTKKSCSLLLKAGQIARRRNYEGLALSTYGAPGKLAVEIRAASKGVFPAKFWGANGIIGLLIGSLIAFNVIIGDLVPSIFHNLSGVEVTWTVRAILMTLLAFGVGLPLSMMRNLKSLSSFSAISLSFYAFFVVQIFFTALPRIAEGSWIYSLNYWRPEKLLNYVPIFALAFACQPQLFALYETLPDPSVKHMEGVVDIGINVVALVYFLVGLFGYVCFYNVGVQGDMLNNYGRTFTSYVIKVGFVMSVIVSFPLMVYPLRASLHSLIFSESSSSENLPGGSGFIQPDRFTYLTLTIISGTLMMGILFPQVEFVLALTGATMGTLIAFVFPSCLFLRAVSEKTNTRLIAKLVLLLGSVCFIAGTYTVLTKQESGHQHHQVDIHPPGIDPIKPMALHNSPQNVNHTNIQGGIKAGPVDVDVAKIGLGGGNQPGDDKVKVVANDGQSIEAHAADVKPADAVGNEGLKRAEEPVKPGEGEEKRQEPAVPHAPQDNPAQGGPDQRKSEDGHLNEKRQLMSQGVEEKPADTNDQAVKAPARNAADTNQVKVSEQEIDEELKKLEHSDKVSLPDGKDKEQDDAALHKDKPQDGKEISLVKRDLQSQDSTSLGNGKVESEKAVEARKSQDVSHKAVNQSDSHKMDKLESLPDSLNTRTSLGISNRTAVKKGYEVMNSIKMRDLKSNSKLNGKQSSSLSSKSFKTLLSKSSSRRTKRSSLQGKDR